VRAGTERHGDGGDGSKRQRALSRSAARPAGRRGGPDVIHLHDLSLVLSAPQVGACRFRGGIIAALCYFRIAEVTFAMW
jgi:hypothetical protein